MVTLIIRYKLNIFKYKKVSFIDINQLLSNLTIGIYGSVNGHMQTNFKWYKHKHN